MDHIHFGSCGCAEEAMGQLDMYSLNEQIDLDQVICLNEENYGSGKAILHRYEKRMSNDHSVRSTIDGELIFIIPFKKEVRIRAINVRCLQRENAPKIAKVWTNRSDIDFDSISSFKPQAQMSLPFDIDTSIKSPVRGNAFSNVNTIVVHLSQPYSSTDELEIPYMGFYGSFTGAARGIVEAKYEAVPMPGDHKLPNAAETGATQHSV